jgi:ferritin-like metal-binding protein YciE
MSQPSLTPVSPEEKEAAMALKSPRGTPSAEKLHTKALPKTAHAAFHRDLSAALDSHLEKTLDMLERVDRIVDTCDSKLKRMKCDAQSGPRKEAAERSAEDAERPVGDTPLVSSEHKARHYATSTYALATFASHLDHPEAVELLKQALEEAAQKEEAAANKRMAAEGHKAEADPEADAAAAGESVDSADAVKARPAGNAHPL